MLKLWRRKAQEASSPPCDRCGKPTGKPFLYRRPDQWWRCEPCEQEITNILFGAAANGVLTEGMLSYTRPLSSGRANEK